MRLVGTESVDLARCVTVTGEEDCPMAATYRPTILSFFDILGFSDLVTKELPAEIERRVQALRATSSIDRASSTQFESRSFQFSDSVVRVVPIDSQANMAAPVGLLFHEVLAIAHAQFEMANQGVFLRGGLTVGDAFFSDTALFGPAMVTAHGLESKLAVYPRVIIDPEAIAQFKANPLLRKDTNTLAQEASQLKWLLRQDADGYWFVDYLRVARNETNSRELYLGLLRNHKTSIEKHLASTKRADVVQKLSWALEYHNSVVAALQQDGYPSELIPDLRIEVSLSCLDA
jgi:hypothetical protein